MRVRIESRIRGEPVRVVWDEGVVTGDRELVERARDMYRSRRQEIDENDVTAFISALELAAGDRVDVTVWPKADPTEHLSRDTVGLFHLNRNKKGVPMGVFEQVKDRASKVVAAGSAQVIDLRDDRRRKSLFCELGELTYRARQDPTISDADIERVVDQLTALDADVEPDEDESAEQADEGPSDEG